MITVTKTFTFDAAHVLPWYDGPCYNLHGHTYHLEVTAAEADTKQPDYLVVDFSVLKDLVKKQVLNDFDHAVILSAVLDPQQQDLLALCQKWKWKYVQLVEVADFRSSTTCENIIEHINQRLEKSLIEMGLKLVKIKLFETPTSFAELT